MNSQQPNNPLHGVTLAAMLELLVEEYGWQGLGDRIYIKCFNEDPSIKSSLKFLRTTEWARKKVEELYVKTVASASRTGSKGASRTGISASRTGEKGASDKGASRTGDKGASRTGDKGDPWANAKVRAAQAIEVRAAQAIEKKAIGRETRDSGS